jgi:neutral ceramidase
MIDSHLMGGVARQVISPPKGIYLTGYKNCNRGNTGINDDLTVTSLVLFDGQKKFAIIACDLLLLNEEIVDNIRLELEPEINPIICCSQTYSAPIGFSDFKSSPKQRRYIEDLHEKIIIATRTAENNLEPIYLTWSQTEVDFSFPRSEQLLTEVSDRSAQVLSVHKEDGQRLATLINFSFPGLALGAGNLQVSADWIGVMRSVVENELGGLSLFLQGASGNLDLYKIRDRHDSRKMMRELGDNVARSVIASCRKETQPVHHVPIQLLRQEVWLPFDTPVTSENPPVNERELLEITRLPGFLSFFARFLLNWRLPWRLRLEEQEGFWSTPMRMNAVRIGDLGIVTFAGAPFSEIGAEIKENSPALHTLVVGTTDGNIGFLPTQKAIEEGDHIADIAPLSYHYPGKLSRECEEETLRSAYRVLDELWFVENLLNDDDF